MKRLGLIASLVLVWFGTPALAQGVQCQVATGTVAASGSVALQCDSSGNLKTVTGATSIAPTPVSGTGGVTAVTVGTSSAQAVAAATRTARLSIQNVSATATIACSLGGTAALNTAGSWTIVPGYVLSFASDTYVPGDALNCIASAASTPATVWSK